MSTAYQLMPRPDWAATTTVAVADGTVLDAAGWARAIFDVRSAPAWVTALFAVREVAARVLRIPPGRPEMLAVREVRGDEALIDTDDRHLRFVVGVRAEDHRLHVTSLVHLKGRRGRLYFAPVRVLHGTVTRAMMRSAVRRAGDVGRPARSGRRRLGGGAVRGTGKARP